MRYTPGRKSHCKLDNRCSSAKTPSRKIAGVVGGWKRILSRGERKWRGGGPTRGRMAEDFMHECVNI